jgi:spore maturation protein SpmA
MFTGQMYTLSQMVNGKQNDALVNAEFPATRFQTQDTALYTKILANKATGYTQNDTLYQSLDNGTIQVCYGKQSADGIFPTCKSAIMDIWLPLIGYLTFFCGLLHLLNDSNAINKLAGVLTPFFIRIFPELPKGHAAYGFMTMNFAANFLGLDNAATPFGLKAMESMQEVNDDKEKASNSQIMFLCLHAAGLTLIPTSIIGYRAAQNATNPSDIMLPCIITSFIGTLAALIFVSLKQRINLVNLVILAFITSVSALIGFILYYVNQLNGIEKFHFTGNLSNGVLLFIILAIVAYSIFQEKVFKANETNIFDSFVNGAKDGFTTGVRVLPYMVAMLVALSIFRNSGLMFIVMGGINKVLNVFQVDPQNY